MRSLLVWLLLLAFVPAVAQSKAVVKKEAKVRAWLAAGKAYKALHQCDAMLGAKPEPLFYALRADAENRIAEHTEAERDARAGMAAIPGNYEALVQLAIAEQGLGEQDSAIVHLKRVLDHAPSAEVTYRLATAYQAKGQAQQARQELTRALEGAPADHAFRAKIYRSIGECAMLTNDSSSARAAFDSSLAYMPNDPITYNSRGWFLYANTGDHTRAIADYDHAIKLNPNYSYAFNNRGWSWYKLGNKERALKDIGRAKRKKIFNPYVYRHLGIIALESGDKVAACTQFRRALDYNFTAMYGDEVQRLVDTNCVNENKGAAPVQAPAAPLDRPTTKPPVRTNAP